MRNETSKEHASISLENGLTTSFLALVALVGTVGNIFVILAILHKRSLRTIPNFFLFDLAVCDLLNASIAVPLRLAEGFIPQSIPCHIVIAVTILFDGLSRINIVFISIDRFTAVRFPFFYDAHVTPARAIVVIIGGWIVMTVFAVLPVFGVGAATPETTRVKEGICFFSTNLSNAYLLIYLILFCLMPLLIVTPINCFLLKASHRQMRTIHNLEITVENSMVTYGSSETSANSTENRRQDDQHRERILLAKQRRILRMILALVCLFIILVAPITVIDLVSSFGYTKVPPVVAKIAVCMIYTNATINVFVYAGFNKEFRKTFVQLIQKGKTRIIKGVTFCLPFRQPETALS